jgi:hypothetical protein
MKLTIGASRASDPTGRIPVVIKDSDYVFTTDFAGTIDCEVGYATGEFGPHVAGAGYIGCGDAGLPDVDTF